MIVEFLFPAGNLKNLRGKNLFTRTGYRRRFSFKVMESSSDGKRPDLLVSQSIPRDEECKIGTSNSAGNVVERGRLADETEMVRLTPRDA